MQRVSSIWLLYLLLWFRSPQKAEEVYYYLRVRVSLGKYWNSESGSSGFHFSFRSESIVTWTVQQYNQSVSL